MRVPKIFLVFENLDSFAEYWPVILKSPTTGPFFVCFFLLLRVELQVLGREEDQRGKVSFSFHRMKAVHYSISMTYHCRLDHPSEAVFGRFLHRKVIPSLFHTTLFGRKTLCLSHA